MSYRNADAAMAEALRKRAESHDAMVEYHVLSGNAELAADYRAMAKSSRKLAATYQAWADEDAQEEAA